MNIIDNVFKFFLLILLVSCSNQSFHNSDNNKTNGKISNVTNKISKKLEVLINE